MWLVAGMPWASEVIAKPADWDRLAQVTGIPRSVIENYNRWIRPPKQWINPEGARTLWKRRPDAPGKEPFAPTDYESRACAFLQTLVDLVFVLSDTELQQTVWSSGNSEYGGSSYEETTELFEENLDRLLAGGLWRKSSLTESQVGALEALNAEIEKYDRGERGRDAAAIVSDPSWGAVVRLAGQTLAELADNGCGVRPRAG